MVNKYLPFQKKKKIVGFAVVWINSDWGGLLKGILGCLTLFPDFACYVSHNSLCNVVLKSWTTGEK